MLGEEQEGCHPLKIVRLRIFSLRNRLLFGMTVMLLPAVVIAAGAMVSLKAVQGSIDELVEELTQEMHPIMALQVSIAKAVMAPNDYLIHGDKEERRTFHRTSLEIDKAFESALAAPFGLTDEGRLLRSSYEEWRQGRAISEAILSLEDPVGDPTAARNMENFDRHMYAAVDNLNQVHDIIEKEAHGLQSDAETVGRWVLIFISSLIVLGLGIAITLGLLLARSILSPVQELKRAAERLAERDLSHRVQLQSGDELSMLAGTFNSMAAKLERSQAALQEMATRDSLTKVYNRREFYRRVKEEVSRAQRYGHMLSVMILDIDNFKDINDSYGHVSGDNTLKIVASLLEREVRPVDLVARYGGDEFGLLLPETPKASAHTLAERICKAIADHPAAAGQGKEVVATVSIGVATFPQDGESEDSLILAADNLLYTAKRAGRNRVCCSVTP